MDGYTITAAAALLGTTRQTIYNRIKKDQQSYAVQTADGKTLITLSGLALLKDSLQARPGRHAAAVGVDKTNVIRNHTALQIEIERLQKLTSVQADELNKAYDRVQQLSNTIVKLEDDKAFLKTQLDKATDKRLTLWDRVVKRLMPGKGDQDPGKGL